MFVSLLSIYLSDCLSAYLPDCLPACLSVCLIACLSVYLVLFLHILKKTHKWVSLLRFDTNNLVLRVLLDPSPAD